MLEAETWARLVAREDGALVVFETIGFDPSGRFDPALRWEPCPVDTPQGAVYDPKTKVYTAPAAPVDPGPVEPETPPAPTYRTTMTPIRFKAQFSLTEQVAIKRARGYVDGADGDAEADKQKAFTRDALDVLFGSLDDPRLAEVDVTDASVIGGIDYCRAVGILTEERATAIKRGVPA